MEGRFNVKEMFDCSFASQPLPLQMLEHLHIVSSVNPDYGKLFCLWHEHGEVSTIQ